MSLWNWFCLIYIHIITVEIHVRKTSRLTVDRRNTYRFSNLKFRLLIDLCGLLLFTYSSCLFLYIYRSLHYTCVQYYNAVVIWGYKLLCVSKERPSVRNIALSVQYYKPNIYFKFKFLNKSISKFETKR